MSVQQVNARGGNASLASGGGGGAIILRANGTGGTVLAGGDLDTSAGYSVTKNGGNGGSVTVEADGSIGLRNAYADGGESRSTQASHAPLRGNRRSRPAAAASPRYGSPSPRPSVKKSAKPSAADCWAPT